MFTLGSDVLPTAFTKPQNFHLMSMSPEKGKGKLKNKMITLREYIYSTTDIQRILSVRFLSNKLEQTFTHKKLDWKNG